LAAEIQKIPISNNAKKGDRVLIVGKKNNGSFGKFVKYSGHSIVVQLDEGGQFNPSSNSVRLVKPKYRSKIEKTNESEKILSVKKTLSFNEDSVSENYSVVDTEKNDRIPDDKTESFNEDSVSEDYSVVDTEKNDRIPDGNYDVKTEKFRKLLKYPNVWISENITKEVYDRIRCAEKLSIHLDGRKYPEKIKNTNWSTQVNAYMKRRGYRDPRENYLISPRSKSYYELWECPGGFDFMRFQSSILRRNEGVKYGHRCFISIVLDNTWYEVLIYM